MSQYTLRFDPHRPLPDDPYSLFRQLREEAPVYVANDVVVLTRFEDVFTATRTPEIFSSAKGLSIEGDDIGALGLPPTLVMLDPPDHTKQRRLISKAFSPQRSQALESKIRSFVRERLDAMPHAASVDIVAELAAPIPAFMLAHLLGMPQSDRHLLREWSEAIVEIPEDRTRRLSRACQGAASMFAYLVAHLERLQRHPGDDLLSELLRVELDGARLVPFDILGFCFATITGGTDTTANLIANGLTLLCENPAIEASLRNDPSQLRHAIVEMLRLESPVQGLARTTTRPITLHGVAVPENAKVLLLYGAANRDPREFGDDADAFRLDRETKRHLAFGHGPHLCVGNHLAQLMARVAFEELLGRFERFEILRAERVTSLYARGFRRLELRAPRRARGAA